MTVRKVLTIIILLFVFCDGTQLFCAHVDDEEHKPVCYYIINSHSEHDEHSEHSRNEHSKNDPFHDSCHYNRNIQKCQIDFYMEFSCLTVFNDFLIPGYNNHITFFPYQKKIPDKIFVRISSFLI